MINEAAGPLPAAITGPSKAAPDGAREAQLLENAKAFEAAFLAQMLAHSGLTESLGANAGFGGEAFSSFLVEEYAGKLVEQGGVGLAEKIYEQLRNREAGDVGGTRA